MENLKRVAIPEGSENRPYYKYYLQDMAPVPAEKLELLTSGPGDNADALLIADRNKIFEPGYLPGEVGYWLMDDGSAVVANLTKCKGVTGEMFQWWFAWHPIDPLRYAIWDPFDHYGTTISETDKERAKNPSISVLEKCFNLDQTVDESLVMGEPPVPIAIKFRSPEYYGMDGGKLGTEDLSFIVCANVEILTPEGMPNVPVFMLHTARDTEDGCELRSRFWLGCHVIDGVGTCLLPPGMKFPEELTIQLLSHNFNEYTNLAAILPSVYAENKNVWE